MISLAIALALILGVNQIFAISTATVGAGEILGRISRDDRTAHAIMWPDVHNAYLGPTPGFIICSQRVWAFRSRADKASAANPASPSTFSTGSGAAATDNSNTYWNTAFNDRNHRIDTLGFFASGDLYRRQTGSGTSFVSQQTSTEAWIWYGHLSLPSNATLKNSAPTFYAPGDTNTANDNNTFASEFILGRMAVLLVPSPAGSDIYMKAGTSNNPLDVNAVSSDGYKLMSARYDQSLTSITSFLANTSLTTAAARDYMCAPAGYRFQANPFPIKPLTNANMAGTAPVFIRNCSQFVVEFAGDYVTQDQNTGAVTAAVPDSATAGNPSVTDFVIDNGIRKIRWYGFPRDINNDGVIDMRDVVPVRDLRSGTAATFERAYPANSASPGPSETYICSWGPDTNQTNDPPPKMLRITLALDDPSGRLADPQVFEYVIDVQ